MNLSRKRLLIIFFGILLGATLSGLDGAIVATAAPTILSELGSVSLLPWLTTSYLLAQVTTMAVYGKLGDIYGRRRVFVIAISTFMVGSMFCGLAQSMPMLIATRVLQGVGAGGITALAMALIADVMPADKLGRYLGYTGVVFAVASVLGPWAGGFFTDNFSWRWAFFVNIPSGIICLLTLLLVPKSLNRVTHRIDVLGAVLIAGAVSSLLLAIGGTGGEVYFVSFRTFGLATLSVALIVLYVLHERRTDEPILALRVIAGRVKALAISANLIAGLAFGSAIVYPPLFFEAVRGISATQAGLLLAPFAVTSGMFTIIAGQITDRRGGHVAVPFVGMIASTLGMVLLSSINASTSAAFVVGSAMLVGVGIGFVMQTLLYVIQRFTAPADIGMATSTIMLARLLGNSLGVAIVGTIFTNSLIAGVEERLPGFPTDSIQGVPQEIAALPASVGQQIQESFADALANGFAAMIPVMIIGVVVTAFLPAKRIRNRLRERPQEIPLAEGAASVL
ncbi:MAG: MDR family MFS transporter [Acidimicrobiales bacterium]